MCIACRIFHFKDADVKLERSEQTETNMETWCEDMHTKKTVAF